MAFKSEFFIDVGETEKHLYVERGHSLDGPLSPCNMTPEDVDRQMATYKNPEILCICGMNQKSLEHFVTHYGKTYRYLEFFKCQLISDFSPLEDLVQLEAVYIYWNIRASRLWNFSKNRSLWGVSVCDAVKLTRNPEPLQTSTTLETVIFCGSPFNNTPMESLACFRDMPALLELSLSNIRLLDHDMAFLETLPKLEMFHFDPGMLTTEEIAWIVAKYPQLSGCSLKPYTKGMLTDVRVCGFRKPGLDLPEHQKRLDKYVAQFDALVEQYRREC